MVGGGSCPVVELPGSVGELFEVDNYSFGMKSAFLKCSFLQHYSSAETQAQRKQIVHFMQSWSYTKMRGKRV